MSAESEAMMEAFDVWCKDNPLIERFGNAVKELSDIALAFGEATIDLANKEIAPAIALVAGAVGGLTLGLQETYEDIK